MINSNSLPKLLINPGLIESGKPIFSYLVISKEGKNIGFDTHEFTHSLIKKKFQHSPELLKMALMDCSVDNVLDVSNNIQHRYSRQKAGLIYETFFSKSFITHWYTVFEGLKPYFPLIKWYHKKEQPGKKNSITAPCSFSTYKPGLSFEVVKINGALKLKTFILLNSQSFPIEIFSRHHFLLIDKNEFFILSNKDYQTLEKLEKFNCEQYSHHSDEFAKHILSWLEEDYPVNRNNLFTVYHINTPPVNRLMLTELNNSFLMLTPQWIYDGFLIEGPYKEKTELIRNGISYSIKRDKDVEINFTKTLIALHKNFANQRNGYFYLSFAEAIRGQWFLKTYQQLLKLDIELVGMDMLVHFRYSPYLPKTEMTLIREIEDVLSFKMEVSFGKEKIPLNELQKMLLAGQKAVMLKDGSLGMLDEEWLKRYASIVKHGKINNKEIEVLRWMAVTDLGDAEENPALREAIKKEWWQKWKQWQKEDHEIYPLSTSLKASLRSYQQKGYEWLRLLQEIGAGACLADDMGLGKTLQAIATIVQFVERNPGSKNIIICPASLIYNWKQEFEKFAPAIQAEVYHGSARQEEMLTDPSIQVIITTYNTMRSDVEIIDDQFYGIAVLDESHNIKNPGTQIAQAVMKLKAHFRMALSGTPVVNNTFDLYSQLNFAVPGLFGSREFFKKEYAIPIDNFHDEDKIAALKKLTAPFVLRRTKEQVAKDLPEKTETVLWCTMNGLQRAVYEEILDNTRSSIFLEIQNNGLAKSKLSILQGMTKLRQVCSSPLLLPDDEHNNCRESVKIEVLMQELDNLLGNHKAIVFSQFTSMLHLLADECIKRDISYYHFDGKTPPEKRAEMVQKFQQDEENVNLFLISLKAGNAGITLTAADYVFLFDPWWNTAVQDQAIDRTHRIGQTKNVFAYKMICKDTIEEKIISLQRKKKKLSEDLVSGDSFVQSLTEEDVQYLFS